MSGTIKIVYSPSCFDPAGDRQVTTWLHLAGTVLDYLPTHRDFISVSVNGETVAPEAWSTLPVRRGDEIVIVGRPGIIPIGAIFAGAIATGAALVPGAAATGAIVATSFSVLSFLQGILPKIAISAGLAYLSSLLIQRPGRPEKDPEFTYGAGGIQTAPGNGNVVPILYGRLRRAGSTVRTR